MLVLTEHNYPLLLLIFDFMRSRMLLISASCGLLSVCPGVPPRRRVVKGTAEGRQLQVRVHQHDLVGRGSAVVLPLVLSQHLSVREASHAAVLREAENKR